MFLSHDSVSISEEDPDSPDARRLLEQLSDELARITGDSGRASFASDDVRTFNACFVLARDDTGAAIGCGAFRPLQNGIAELKRMYSRPGTRGVGSAILTFLEHEAIRLGYEALWLETRRINERAVSFYTRRGYRPIPNFGKYIANFKAICFEKKLVTR
jgi:GNAT superfamily N-acetyltransferase